MARPHEAIQNLEQSLAHGRPRALIQMATGSGKTFAAVSACHRLIKRANAKRILFLVDRNNLGKQTLNEFQQFRDPGSAYTFSEEFVVQRLRGNAIDPAAKVVITTIQRLYSILKGDPEYDAANEEESMFESGGPLGGEPARRRTRSLEADLTYTANQLDRDVVAPDQIRLVARTFGDHLFTKIFPGREEVPRTLVFAKNDSHADDIVKILKEEFGKGNDFCRKITSKTTGASPEDLLSSFRNSYNPRIAVTGT